VLPDDFKPRQSVEIIVEAESGGRRSLTATARIDTPVEAAYYRHGGILPYVVRQIVAQH